MQNVPLGECLLRSCYSIQKRPPRSTVGGVTTLAAVRQCDWNGEGNRVERGRGVITTDFVRSYVIFISAAKEIALALLAKRKVPSSVGGDVPPSRSIAQWPLGERSNCPAPAALLCRLIEPSDRCCTLQFLFSHGLFFFCFFYCAASSRNIISVICQLSSSTRSRWRRRRQLRRWLRLVLCACA